MKRYEFSSEAVRILENLDVPFIIGQIISNRIVPLLVTNGFCDMLDLNRRDIGNMFDKDMYRAIHPDDRAFVADLGNRFAAGTISDYDCVFRSFSSERQDYGIVHAMGKHIIMEDGTPLIIVHFMDESAHVEGEGDDFAKDIQSVFSQMISNKMPLLNSYYDALTGLPNMPYFFELAEAGREELVKKGEVPAIISFDFNGLREFNSKYGIEEGNKLLCTLASILSDLYKNDNCARFGEDHFYVFTSANNIEKKINQVFYRLENSNDGKVLPLRVGVYKDEINVSNMGEACDRAKIACDYDRNSYLSKIVYFDTNMLRETAVRDYVLNYIDAALEEKWIIPYFQPVMRSISGKVTEEEALARWIDPKRGAFSPNDFIPVLEESKLMYKLDLYMVDRVIESILERIEKGINPVPVSINISRTDFECCDMVSLISEKIDQANLSHKLIKVEITESVLGENPALLKKEIKRFHDEGICVWMDNFGSGYSALNVIQEFDVDAIKLDTKFMKQFKPHGRSYPIIVGLIRMAKSLGIRVIAQGVETESQKKMLKALGCDSLQGYYFFQPMSLKKILEICAHIEYSLLETESEKRYYDKICSLRLTNPVIEGDCEMCNTIRSRIYGAPIAIVEWDGKKLKLLRLNEAYVYYLKRFNLLSEDGFLYEDTEPLSRMHMKQLMDVIDDVCLCSFFRNEWETLGIKKDYVRSSGFVKKVAENDEDSKVALMLILPIY